jgi:cyclohexadieny/prephenate dehydrogenase
MALLGTGHIGGSLALAMRRARLVREVVGFDARPAHAARARARGIVTRVAASAAAAVRGADLVVFAVPVGATASVARAIAKALPDKAIVHDVGSTKVDVLATLERLLSRPERVVGGHPIAGTERTGPDAASAGLFGDRLVFLTPTARTDADALRAIDDLWRRVGASRVERVSPEVHDDVMAAVSHLPHVAAYSLAGTVRSLGDAVLGVSGGGLRDTTRIAGSDPVMWRDIFLANRDALLPLVDRFVDDVRALRRLIERGDRAALLRSLVTLRGARQELVG